MAVGATPRGSDNIPLGCGLSPGDTTPQQIQLGAEYTDANSDISAPIMAALSGDSWESTFSASYSGLAGVAGDLFVLGGSPTAGRVVKLVKMEISGLATTAASPIIKLDKRSTADSGGTKATAVTIAPHDSNQSIAAATATVDAYTAVPTAGTSVGFLKAALLGCPVAGATPTPVVWDFTNSGKAPVLRGTAQQLVLTLSAAPTGGSIQICCTWTEK